MINLVKSEVCFGKDVDSARRVEVAGWLGVRHVVCHEKYLGLPTFTGRSKKDLFAFIKDRVWKKVRGWNNSIFLGAGKEILTKAVIQALPSHAMACFKLPKSMIRDLHRFIANFWWGSNNGKSKLHWSKWGSMCLGKEYGGMSFRDLGCFNQALLAKQGWRIIRNPNSLVGHVLKASYFPRSSFLLAKKGSNASFIWRSILWGR
ncbi:hypothetical protein UlMin_023435 [Ulmus minor]